MDAVEELSADHARFDEEIAAIRTTGSGPSAAKAARVERLTTDFEQHAAIEEAVFYEGAGHVVPEGIVEKLLVEHHLLDVVIGDMARQPVGVRGSDARLAVLLDVLERHLRHEEALLFAPVTEQLDPRQRRELASLMARYRDGDPNPRRTDELADRRAASRGRKQLKSARRFGRRRAAVSHRGPSNQAAGGVVEPSRERNDRGVIDYPIGDVAFADGRPKAVGSQELFSPTTIRQTASGFWGLYAAGDEVIGVHPWGAVQGPRASVAEALQSTTAGRARRAEDREALATLLTFLGAPRDRDAVRDDPESALDPSQPA